MAEKERLEAVVKKLSLKFQKKADEPRKYQETRARFQQPYDETLSVESIHRQLFSAAPSIKEEEKTEQQQSSPTQFSLFYRRKMYRRSVSNGRCIGGKLVHKWLWHDGVWWWWFTIDFVVSRASNITWRTAQLFSEAWPWQQRDFKGSV